MVAASGTASRLRFGQRFSDPLRPAQDLDCPNEYGVSRDFDSVGNGFGARRVIERSYGRAAIINIYGDRRSGSVSRFRVAPRSSGRERAVAA